MKGCLKPTGGVGACTESSSSASEPRQDRGRLLEDWAERRQVWGLEQLSEPKERGVWNHRHQPIAEKPWVLLNTWVLSCQVPGTWATSHPQFQSLASEQYNNQLASCTWLQMTCCEWFLTEVIKSTSGLSVCVDKDLEPVLCGGIFMSTLFPVIFVYKLLAMRIIYILIMSAQPPVRGKSSSLFTSYWQASEETA